MLRPKYIIRLHTKFYYLDIAILINLVLVCQSPISRDSAKVVLLKIQVCQL